MQIIQSQGNIVEKVIRDKEGRLVRAKFFVYESAGRIKARLIDVRYLDTRYLTGKILSLAGFLNTKFSATSDLKVNLASPIYYLFSNIYSIGSKPRAPTFV